MAAAEQSNKKHQEIEKWFCEVSGHWRLTQPLFAPLPVHTTTAAIQTKQNFSVWPWWWNLWMLCRPLVVNFNFWAVHTCFSVLMKVCKSMFSPSESNQSKNASWIRKKITLDYKQHFVGEIYYYKIWDEQFSLVKTITVELRTRGSHLLPPVSPCLENEHGRSRLWKERIALFKHSPSCRVVRCKCPDKPATRKNCAM